MKLEPTMIQLTLNILPAGSQAFNIRVFREKFRFKPLQTQPQYFQPIICSVLPIECAGAMAVQNLCVGQPMTSLIGDLEEERKSMPEISCMAPDATYVAFPTLELHG